MLNEKEMNQTKWFKWSDKNKIEQKDQPAIYFIAHSKEDLSGKDFELIEEIIYIGMTASDKGLIGRLYQFEMAILKNKDGVHGGAERVRFKHKNAQELFDNLYVSARIFPISETRTTPDDWRMKGDCVGSEYKYFADYLEKFGCLPEFNDQKKSKKK